MVVDANAKDRAAFVKHDARLVGLITSQFRLLLFQNACNSGIQQGQDSVAAKIFCEKLDEVDHEFIEVDKDNCIEKLDKLANDSV